MSEPFLIHNVYNNSSQHFCPISDLQKFPHWLVILDLRRGTRFRLSVPTRLLSLGGGDAPRPVSYGGLEFPDPLLEQLRGLLVLGLPSQVDVLVLVQDLNVV